MSSGNETSNDRKDSKRLKSPGIDRISALPEALILHILSLLTTRDKIITGALSRRWRNLWTCVPNLHFHWDYDKRDRFGTEGDFVKGVNKTLFLILLSGRSKVKEFVVQWPYDRAYANDVHVWTRFAARNETEKFVLDFDPDEGEIQFYELPESLYTNPFFRELQFSNCYFSGIGSVSWNSLKKLTISYGVLGNGVLEKIVAGAPALEFLDMLLEECTSCFHIGNSGLKKLILHIHSWVKEEEDDAAIQILAPSVQSLKVSGLFRTCKLIDMTSLVEATLFGLNIGSHVPEYPILTQEVLYSLLNVQTLTLGTWVIQGIAKLPTKDGRPLFPKCKCLTVDTHLWKEDPSAIATLLKSTPEVETLIVTISEWHSKCKFFQDGPSGHGNSNIDQYWTSQEMGSNYVTLLRTVKFIGSGLTAEL